LDVQYIRLSEEVCHTLNVMALERRITVSDLVNEVMRAYLAARGNAESKSAG